MILKEEQRDLFSVPHGYYFAHCISGDFTLGAGIAVVFNELYNMRKKLKINMRKKLKINISYDDCDCVNCDEHCAILIDNVFNLITKRKYYNKPTYNSLREALENMAEQVEEFKIEKIAIPQIGCGLDKLNWNLVKGIIEEVFEDIDVEILVCYL